MIVKFECVIVGERVWGIGWGEIKVANLWGFFLQIIRKGVFEMAIEKGKWRNWTNDDTGEGNLGRK